MRGLLKGGSATAYIASLDFLIDHLLQVLSALDRLELLIDRFEQL